MHNILSVSIGIGTNQMFVLINYNFSYLKKKIINCICFFDNYNRSKIKLPFGSTSMYILS